MLVGYYFYTCGTSELFLDKQGIKKSAFLESPMDDIFYASTVDIIQSDRLTTTSKTVKKHITTQRIFFP